MANAASLPQSLRDISGVIPIDQTLGLWQGMLIALVLILVSMAIAYYSHPAEGHARTMADMGITSQPHKLIAVPYTKKPGEWLENSPLFTLLISSLGLAYLGREVATGGFRVLLDLNHYIFAFLVVGMLLHWRPRHFVEAINSSIPSVAGVLIQYPLYAGIVKMMTESGLATKLAHSFVSVSTRHTFPMLVGIYSAFLGLFIPSAGGKWLIEAPYLLEASKSLKVHLGWVVQTYNATEALANLIHPFWMLPLLGILGMKPRDVVGYSMLQFVVHVPVVLLMVWLLNYTLEYVPPVLP
jgi:short-chain fatty acids transporter